MKVLIFNEGVYYYMYHLLNKNKINITSLKKILEIYFYLTAIDIHFLDDNYDFITSYTTDNNVNKQSIINKEALKDYITTIIDDHKNIASNKDLQVSIYSTDPSSTYLILPLIINNIFRGTIISGPFVFNIEGNKKNNRPVLKSPRHIYLSHLLKLLFTYPLSTSTYESMITSYYNLPINIHVDSSPSNITRIKNREETFLNFVRTGQVSQACNFFMDHYTTKSYANLSSKNTLRSLKNNSIALCTLLTRTAISGGVDADYSRKMSDEFIIHVENCNSLEDIISIMVSMIESFTEIVRKNQSTTEDPMIHDCIQYIHKHYTTKITINLVAKELNFSPNYLSTIFNQKMGISFANYINKVRIENSKYYLRYTDTSLVEIASFIGYKDQSYFTKIFKKFEGITPKAYRDRKNYDYFSL